MCVRKYYKDDFRLSIKFVDSNGKTCPVPEVDFVGRIFTDSSTRQIIFAQKDGIAHGWSVGPQEGVILISFDHHGLMPGKLIAKVDYQIPHEGFGDNAQLVSRYYDLGIELVARPCCTPCNVEVNLDLPFAVIHDTDIYADVIRKVNEKLGEALGRSSEDLDNNNESQPSNIIAGKSRLAYDPGNDLLATFTISSMHDGDQCRQHGNDSNRYSFAITDASHHFRRLEVQFKRRKSGPYRPTSDRWRRSLHVPHCGVVRARLYRRGEKGPWRYFSYVYDTYKRKILVCRPLG